MMMDSVGSSLIIPVPNIITSSPSGGRFDFDDGGVYCGGWQDGKAHGHGVCTGPKNVGEYSGSWNFGFEMSGVYKWKNGAVYEGRWQNGKRHGVGVEYNGKWIYKGEWSQGFKGRYGVKASSNSAVKYEGTWANGLQDGYGSETYSDGGYYQGQMCRGLRHGYGVRKSAPYGDSQLNNPNKSFNGLSGGGQLIGSSSMMIHSNSLQSAHSVDLDDDSPKPEDGFKPNIDRTLASKNGFVLVAKPLDVPMASMANNSNSGDKLNNFRRNSLTGKLQASAARIPGSNQTASLLRGLRLKKQKSTSDLDTISGSANKGNKISGNSNQQQQQLDSDLPLVPFTLSPEELDITDPTTVETYTGEWKHDKRNGHGVCERSDGLKYEGQWHNDMKCGYGVTTFKDGSKEEGKYKNNILINDSKIKRFFQLGGSNMRQRIDDSVKMALQAQTTALKKAEIAESRAATARDKADQATTAALEADRDSQIAFSVARQYSDTNQQLGMQQQPAIYNSNQMMFADQQGDFVSSQQQQQFRRVSQHMQPPQFMFNAGTGNNNNPGPNNQGAMHQMMNEQQQEGSQLLEAGPNSQPRQTAPFPSNLEPFNGRRGSFRSGSQPSSGYQSAFASRANQNQHSTIPGNTLGGAKRASAMALRAPMAGSGDPFNDLFDHYKPTTSSSTLAYGNQALNQNGGQRRMMLTKQSSLDQSNLRAASVSRQLQPSEPGYEGSSSRLRKFRMSSMDHAEENATIGNSGGGNGNMRDGNFENISPEMPADGRQFRYLITSGEQLQAPDQNALTPTGSSSYILHQSPNSSSFVATNQSPSPDGQSSFRSPSSQFYQQQRMMYQQQANQEASYQQQFNQMGLRQRDVHSLADEQLYLVNRRFYDTSNLLDKSEYSNYDFTITSSPRLSRRLMRRTNSLSRNTPIKSGPISSSSSTTRIGAGTATLNPFEASRLKTSNTNADFHLNNSPLLTASKRSPDEAPLKRSEPNHAQAPENQPEQQRLDELAPSNSSHLTLSSAGSSALIRKPSLQVRYDPNDLGGLMSREEVAALSHAQREQKRLEAQLAEQKSKRPILHLYLSLREFLTRQKLILTVLIVNVFLFKMFADLIV